MAYLKTINVDTREVIHGFPLVSDGTPIAYILGKPSIPALLHDYFTSSQISGSYMSKHGNLLPLISSAKCFWGELGEVDSNFTSEKLILNYSINPVDSDKIPLLVLCSVEKLTSHLVIFISEIQPFDIKINGTGDCELKCQHSFRGSNDSLRTNYHQIVNIQNGSKVIISGQRFRKQNYQFNSDGTVTNS
jgi:hypothetical protein